MPAELAAWLNERKENKVIFEKLIKEDQLKTAIDRYNMIDAGMAWENVSKTLFPEKNTIRKTLWPQPAPNWIRGIAIAAAAVMAVVFGIWFYNTSLNPDSASSRTAGRDLMHDIKPGKNTATLTLSNGKAIELSEEKTGLVVGNDLRYNDGTSVTSNKDPDNGRTVEMTITTPRGGTYQVTLSDGTKVWLNAASSLTYTRALNEKGTRRVRLAGEGYFEVAKDKTHPFVVSTKGEEVKVLGTHFNISSYADEKDMKTTLLEGSVLVSRGAADVNGVLLKPSEQATVTGNAITIRQVDVNEAVAWKNGDFRFADQSITDIMKQIARWYDIEVVYEADLSAVRLTGSISRNRNLSQLLKRLGETNEVHFKIEGRRVIVNK
ncbi:fec operon regulator FecR [compost metagenome]